MRDTQAYAEMMKSRYGFFGVHDSVLCDSMEEMQERLFDRYKRYKIDYDQCSGSNNALVRSLAWNCVLHKHFTSHMMSASPRRADELYMDRIIKKHELCTDVDSLTWKETGFEESYRIEPSLSKVVFVLGGLDSYRFIEPRIISQAACQSLPVPNDVRIIVCDYPGQSGTISGVGLRDSWDDYISTLQSMIDRYWPADCFLMGVSLGGTLALRAASELNGISRVIGLGPVVSASYLEQLLPVSRQRLHQAIRGGDLSQPSTHFTIDEQNTISGWFEEINSYKPHPESYLINGGQDHLVGTTEYSRLPFSVMHQAILPGAEHVATTLFDYVLPVIGDLIGHSTKSFEMLKALNTDVSSNVLLTT